MRKWAAIAVGLAILAVANYSIHSRERLLTDGRIAYLELAPVDPRSLMQGDYMALRFKAADDAFRGKHTPASDGYLVLRPDPRGVATFVRFDEGAVLGSEEFRMRYRVRNDRMKFGTNAYFFQEGHASRFSTARYGEFRVDPASGEAILTNLRGRELQLLR
jgi:uncharacterized membrane-anchored protein